MFRRRWFWSGLLLVLAGAFRQVAAVNLLLAVVAVVWLEPAGHRLRSAGSLAAGVSGALAAGALGLLLTGSLAGFWPWHGGSLHAYASATWISTSVCHRPRGTHAALRVALWVLW